MALDLLGLSLAIVCVTRQTLERMSRRDLQARNSFLKGMSGGTPDATPGTGVLPASRDAAI